MSRQRRENQAQQDPSSGGMHSGGPVGFIGMATLGGVALLLLISFSNWRELGTIESRLDGRLGQLDTRLGQLDARIDAVSDKVGTAPARAQRRGPDPDKAYTIKTAGAPAKGPPTAAVTVVEFSDFQ